jgi:pimeloyl-ACP methyl ester carboxylesterase
METESIFGRMVKQLDKLPVERPLAALNGERPEAPDWYRALELEPPETFRPVVEGAAIEVLAWGEKGRPGLLLAHGNAAHARWWGPVAPLLARDYRVVSLSYSGMGGSDWRPAYSFGLQVEELFAAAQAGGLFEAEQPPIFVGHSFGARAVARALHERGGELTGGVIVDGTLLPPSNIQDRIVKEQYFENAADALKRFNLKPPQPCDNLYILDHVARASIVETDKGWRWRFDPDLRRHFNLEDVWNLIAEPRGRIAFVYGQDSAMINAEVLAAQRKQVPAGAPFVGIPAAGHHLMFDQPIALAAALSALMQAWLGTE